MAIILKTATFRNNELRTNTNATSVVDLEPDTGSDPFRRGFCVKVVEMVRGKPTDRYWGGIVQVVTNGKAMARLKYQVGHCTDVPEAAAQDDAKGGDPPRGKPLDTTDVAVTIDNTSTAGDTSTVNTRDVSVLP
jgi:hypothetical protein